MLLEGSDVLHLSVLGYGEVAGLEVADGIVICVCNDYVFDDKIGAAAKGIDGGWLLGSGLGVARRSDAEGDDPP